MTRWLQALTMLIALTSGAAAESSFDCVIDPSEVVKLGSPIPGVLAEVLDLDGDHEFLMLGRSVVGG